MERERRAMPVVVPGEIIAVGNYKAGENTIRIDGSIVATRVGIPKIGTDRVSVIPLRGTYKPRINDLVIGTVTDVSYNMWKLDINSPYPGILPAADVFGRRFDPTQNDLFKKFHIGTVLKARILAFNRTQDPLLTIRGKDLGKVESGSLVKIDSSKIARVIGRGGSMLSKIQQTTNSKLIVGQNGVILITTEDPRIRDKIMMALKLIEQESHTYGLTEKVVELLSG